MCKNRALTELREELKPLDPVFFLCWTMLSQLRGENTKENKPGWGALSL